MLAWKSLPILILKNFLPPMGNLLIGCKGKNHQLLRIIPWRTTNMSGWTLKERTLKSTEQFVEDSLSADTGIHFADLSPELCFRH